jgi:hypothetical protein
VIELFDVRAIAYGELARHFVDQVSFRKIIAG